MTHEHPHLETTLWEARRRFESWADMDAPRLPPDPIDAMQLQLVRWQVRNFGPQPDVNIALGIIEEAAEAGAAHTEELLIDALGDVLIYTGQICISNRMALGPIMRLADSIYKDWLGASDEVLDNRSAQPAVLMGKLAHDVLKHAQGIRGLKDDEIYRRCLVWDFAQIIASVMLDIVLMFDVADVDTLLDKTYIDVGTGVVLKRDWVNDPATGVPQST